MIDAILQGKLGAGNLHVRFDGEVAAAKPRRGSLLYNVGTASLRRGMVALGIALIATSALAEVYHTVGGIKSKGWNTGAWEWADSTDTPVAVTPAENDGNVWVLYGNKVGKMDGDVILPNTTWYWGSDGRAGWPAKAQFVQNSKAVEYFVPTCTVYGCSVYANDKGTLTVNGVFTFVNVGLDFEFYGSASGADERNITFGDKFAAIANSDVQIIIPSKTASTYSNHVTLEGDFSAFKGKFKISLRNGSTWINELRLLSATAMGDTSYPRTDAFILGKLCKLVMGPNVVQSADRGITFDMKASESAYVGTLGAATDESTITAPLYGSTGTLIKNDAGMVTIAGPLEMEHLVVSEGTLKLAASATLPDNLSVEVQEGATLCLSAKWVGRVTTSGAGTVATEPVEVVYHPKDGGTPAFTTPVDLGDGFDPQGMAVQVKLTPALPLPLNETNRLAVVTIPNGTLPPDAFAYANVKVCDLPVTWFETEIDPVTKMETVYLVARPALGEKTKAIGDASVAWSDGLGLHAGADYFNISTVTSVYSGETRLGTGSNQGVLDFRGFGAFTFGSVIVKDYRSQVLMDEFRFYDGAELRIIYGTSEVEGLMYRHVDGDIYIDASSTENSPFVFTAGTGTDTYTDNDLRAKLRGSGAVKFHSLSLAAAKDHPERPGVIKVTGDNSGFTGQFRVMGVVSGKNNYAMLVSVTNAMALGGAPGAFDSDGVSVCAEAPGYAVLRADGSMEVEASNRGWELRNGTLRTPAGVALVVKTPVRIDTLAIKDGLGTLAFGGDVSTVNDGSLSVREGFLQVASSETLADVPVSFADLTDGGISVDAVATDSDYQSKGLMASSLVLPASGSVSVKVKFSNWTRAMGDVVRAVVTVPAGGPNLRGRLAPARMHGAKVTILDPVENADGSTTYFASAEPKGVILVVR